MGVFVLIEAFFAIILLVFYVIVLKYTTLDPCGSEFCPTNYTLGTYVKILLLLLTTINALFSFGVLKIKRFIIFIAISIPLAYIISYLIELA